MEFKLLYHLVPCEPCGNHKAKSIIDTQKHCKKRTKACDRNDDTIGQQINNSSKFYLSTITQDVNGLNSLSKRHRITE